MLSEDMEYIYCAYDESRLRCPPVIDVSEKIDS